jgi:hypothetical protein
VIGITPGFEGTARRVCQALANSGPVSVSDFDDDWTPTGEAYRDELVTGGLVEVTAGGDDVPPMIVLTGAGVALALGQVPVDADANAAP